jgi:hypothetical protein
VEVAMKIAGRHLPFIRPIGSVMLIGCILLPLVKLIQHFWVSWEGSYLLVCCCVVAAEAGYLGFIQKGAIGWRWRFLELGGIFVFIQISQRLISPQTDLLINNQVLAELGVNDSTFSFTEIRFIAWLLSSLVDFLIVLLAWIFSRQITEAFDRLDQPVEEDIPSDHSPPSSIFVLRRFHHQTPPPSFVLIRALAMGGITLLILIAFVRGLGIAAHPLLLSGILLIYSLVGLFLVGQARLVSQRSRWRTTKVMISPALHHQWLYYNLFFLGLVAFFVYIIPTPVAYIPKINLQPDFTSHATPEETPYPLPTDYSETTPVAEAPLEDDSRQVNTRSALCGAIVIITCAILVLGFYGWRKLPRPSAVSWDSFETAPTRSWGAQVTRWWEWILSLFSRIKRKDRDKAKTESAASQPREKTINPTPESRLYRLLRWGSPTLREQIYFYYWSLLKRAGEQGWGRHPGQTPYEYNATLSSEWPSHQEAIIQLTEAFVEARYSQQAIDVEQVHRMRDLWGQIRNALRGRSNRSSRVRG